MVTSLNSDIPFAKMDTSIIIQIRLVALSIGTYFYYVALMGNKK